MRAHIRNTLPQAQPAGAAFTELGSSPSLVTLTRRQEHITPIYRNLHWLPVHYRIILLLTYKALNGLAPDYIKDLLKYNHSRRTLRSTNNRLLDEPRANLKTYGERAFSVAAPRLWNKLSLQIRLSSSEAVFKTNLKTHLFKRAFDLYFLLVVLTFY